MNIKELISWSWQHKWWFVISVCVCGVLGMFYFLVTPPKRVVSAAIMLRTPDLQTQQGEIMSMMGVDGSKTAMDEIKVLTSRDLMEQIVDSLHLVLTVKKKHHLRWTPVFPCPDFALTYEQPVLRKKTYRVTEQGEKYRITVYPRNAAVDRYIKKINVARLARESQVITMTTISNNPQQAVAILNMLLDLYNNASANDRNAIARQSQAFLDEHFAQVRQELTEAETALELYKSEHQITNVAQTAAEYHALIESYQHQLADINLDLKMLDNLDKQLNDSLVLHNQSLIYGHVSDGSLASVINTFNGQILQRMTLMETATENNPMVIVLDKQIEQQRCNIALGAKEVRVSLKLRQEHLNGQLNKYSASLALLPEQERTFLEMKRNVQTMEEQYLYLIRKSEENKLILVSSSLPAKVVEKAQMDAEIKSPNLIKTGFGAVVFGFVIPIFIFLFGIFRKEYLL